MGKMNQNKTFNSELYYILQKFIIYTIEYKKNIHFNTY